MPALHGPERKRDPGRPLGVHYRHLPCVLAVGSLHPGRHILHGQGVGWVWVSRSSGVVQGLSWVSYSGLGVRGVGDGATDRRVGLPTPCWRVGWWRPGWCDRLVAILATPVQVVVLTTDGGSILATMAIVAPPSSRHDHRRKGPSPRRRQFSTNGRGSRRMVRCTLARRGQALAANALRRPHRHGHPIATSLTIVRVRGSHRRLTTVCPGWRDRPVVALHGRSDVIWATCGCRTPTIMTCDS